MLERHVTNLVQLVKNINAVNESLMIDTNHPHNCDDIS